MAVAVASPGVLGFQGRVCNNLIKTEKQDRWGEAVAFPSLSLLC